MLWKYEDLRSLVLKSSELVTPEQAGRRVVYLVNDKRKDVSAAVGWLYTGIQVTRPGEALQLTDIKLLLYALSWKVKKVIQLSTATKLCWK